MNKILTRLQNWHDYSEIHLKMLIFALHDLLCNPKAHSADVWGNKKKAGRCLFCRHLATNLAEAQIWMQTAHVYIQQSETKSLCRRLWRRHGCWNDSHCQVLQTVAVQFGSEWCANLVTNQSWIENNYIIIREMTRIMCADLATRPADYHAPVFAMSA